MDYIIEFSSQFVRFIKKLKEKGKKLFEQIQSKLFEIVKNPGHYKPLKNVLAGYRRIHFVHIYKIEENVARIISLDHHDKAY